MYMAEESKSLKMSGEEYPQVKLAWCQVKAHWEWGGVFPVS